MSKNSGAQNIIIKIVALIIGIILFLLLSFYVIMDRIVNLTYEFFKDLGTTVINIGVKYLEEILHMPFEGDLKFYKIDEDVVSSLKDNLENSGINTEACGLTQVRLKKILLAQAISTSFSQTLCMSTVTEEEILENVKQKDKYKDIESLNDFLNNPTRKKDSKDLWPERYNYTLYYDSEKFFYFQDKDNIFGGGENQWYLGAMGAIKLTKEDGTGMVYGNSVSFEEQKQDFLAAKETWISGDDSFSEEEVLRIYTDGDSPNEIKVWNITTKQRIYDYTFKNEKNNIEIEKHGKDKSYTYDLQPQVINVEEKLDTSSFAISIELMIDLLNMTSSGEFLETFIDYALRDLEVSAKVFQTDETQIAYSKEKFNISDEFIIEVYDLITGDGNATDAGDDNFRAYSDIIYERKYEGNPLPSGSVAELLKNEGEINRDGESKGTATISYETATEYLGRLGSTAVGIAKKGLDYTGDLADKSAFLATVKTEFKEFIANDEGLLNLLGSLLSATGTDAVGVVDGFLDSIFEGKEFTYNSTYKVSELNKYLETAYDPGTGFSLGVIEVEEKIRTKTYQTSCDISVSNVQTWYGEFEYSEPEVIKNYYLSIGGEQETEITEQQYIEFEYSKLEEDSSVLTSETKERIYTSNSIAAQYQIKYGASIGSDGKKIEQYSYFSGGTDLTDEVFKRKPGENNTDHYDAWTSRGLFEIGVIDNGIYNRNLGAGTGSDYIYLKYVKDNRKKYKDTTKIERESLDTSNVTRTMSDSSTEAKLKNFLELLKNNTGNIPRFVGSEGGFKQDGIVVEYGDIYKGHIAAGDLLLDNGALMLFEILESNDSTQSLVNVFKYLAYLYTGVDYGVTDISDIEYIFNFSEVSPIFGNSLEEKVWFALKDLGFSDIAVAGAMGNLYVESGGFNPSAIEGGSGEGIGLCQWSYGRKTQLKNYAASKGVDWTDENTQIEFLITEITGGGSAQGYATKQWNDTALNSWANASTVEAATEVFCYKFERPGIPHIDRRKNMANTYYEKFKGKTKPAIGNYSGEAGEKMCAAAEVLREHCTKNNYVYNTGTPNYSEGVRALWNKNGVCCASYVAWVLVESGVVSEDYINTLAFRGVDELGTGLKKSGKFQNMGQISQSKMQKGDIIFWPNHHTQMYAGDGYWFNGGASGPNVTYNYYNAPQFFASTYGWNTYYILRPIN